MIMLVYSLTVGHLDWRYIHCICYSSRWSRANLGVMVETGCNHEDEAE